MNKLVEFQNNSIIHLEQSDKIFPLTIQEFHVDEPVKEFINNPAEMTMILTDFELTRCDNLESLLE